MNDRASSDLPPPERTGETLWVVDVTAPLAPSRVRWVAAEAAARLQLPAEKLVALLENRIGPVTKPLPKVSADRVAEVLDLAGAEVAIRAAGPANGGRASVEGREPSEPGSSDAAPGGASEYASAPESSAAPPPQSPTQPLAERPTERPTEQSTERATEPATDAETGAPTEADVEAHVEADIEAHVEVDAGEGSARSKEVAREEAARTRTDEQAAAAEAPTSARDEGPRKPERPSADAETLPPVGRPGTTRRDGDRRDDPWQSLGSDEDEAMLGAWTHRAGSALKDPSSTASSTGSSRLDAARGGAPREAPRPAPPAAAPGRRPTSSVVPAFDPSEFPDEMIDRDADEDDEDEGWAFGLRDPFAEAERQERAMRRWALVVALLVALGIFLVLQWAYSRPGLGERTPPSYAVGLTAYREGAFVSAARAWAPRAEAGDVDAMFMLGWMAEYGQGRPWSNREAASWYGQAAQRGHAPSQLRLADLYAQGLGVAFDPDVATRWYLAAAEAGLPRAQWEAALAMAREGRHAEAVAWLDRAAVHDTDAAAWLALLEAARTLNPRSE